MAGTLTISTLSDGTNSTSSTNCIQGSAKAWVNFNGVTTATVRSSFNVSSVTRNGTGDYTVNFTTAMSDANYSIAGSGSTPGSFYNAFIAPYSTAPTTASCRVATYNFGAYADSTYCSVVINR